MTPAEFRAARHKLGLSAQDMADALLIVSGRTIRRWEAGDRDIPGPAIVALRYMLKFGLDTIRSQDVPKTNGPQNASRERNSQT